MKKKCSKCFKVKPLTEFRRKTNGHRTDCKSCERLMHELYYEINKDSLNRDSREHYAQNREGIIAQKLTKRKTDQAVRQRYNAYQRRRRAKNITARLHAAVSAGVNACLRKRCKVLSDVLPFTLLKLKAHLETLFQPGMSWKNYGTHRRGEARRWQIDHIKPVSAFTFTTFDDTEFQECWALENLQPLWADENSRKGNKYGKEEAAKK